ncbi:hypothetical protein E2562_036470 [Oryza meyeriana var. granulata]|uniref:Uncharacterized protein n=1 Tax=Oryza meyeriana var. granulata TaxID=110450 RepID=A0A6G1C188_9ORYZ|nr:hypothetical protein E2562_036470 [Oryza meyeriana var. granulata]
MEAPDMSPEVDSDYSRSEEGGTVEEARAPGAVAQQRRPGQMRLTPDRGRDRGREETLTMSGGSMTMAAAALKASVPAINVWARGPGKVREREGKDCRDQG